jgi:hypothetical protein
VSHGRATHPDTTVKPRPDQPIPRLVRQDAWLLEAATGQPGEVIRLGKRRWRLTLANTRMSYAIDYAPNSKQRLTYGREILLVGGRPAEVRNLNDIARAYHDADKDGFFPRTDPTPMPPGRELADAPPNVRVHHDCYASQHSIELDVGFSSASGWVSGATLPGLHIRFFFCQDHNRIWQSDPRYLTQVIAGGSDISATRAEKLTRMVSRLANGAPAAPAPDGDSTVDAAAGPARRVSTEVRDTVVLRL